MWKIKQEKPWRPCGVTHRALSGIQNMGSVQRRTACDRCPIGRVAVYNFWRAERNLVALHHVSHGQVA